jgi:hypothetical protein
MTRDYIYAHGDADAVAAAVAVACEDGGQGVCEDMMARGNSGGNSGGIQTMGERMPIGAVLVTGNHEESRSTLRHGVDVSGRGTAHNVRDRH